MININENVQQAIHVDWKDLSLIMSELLSGVLKREVEAEAGREENDFWLIYLIDTPISKAELELVLKKTAADEIDRDQNDFGMYPVMELSQGICNKLLGPFLPYKLTCTMTDYDGVWFIGSNPPDRNNALLETVLPDGISLIAETWEDPDYPGIRISSRQSGQKDELLCFAEYNTAKPEGKRLCISAYAAGLDEPAYYESYCDPQPASSNV